MNAGHGPRSMAKSYDDGTAANVTCHWYTGTCTVLQQ